MKKDRLKTGLYSNSHIKANLKKARLGQFKNFENGSI
ncbi:hypothetical protein CHY_2138 [Carboxydothermus hydrogenoformans Z-2901]|uniref:Uncharacterized protein n=1 Tax=Carboxydothermus hydrogenoformans (strain ATCC BAA-161 / DSM 6008 / Z-2901) TaxID=246194 RepID=Q3AA82_CARHZ|nr:hypothetical protein CHY_2138 [Carboxydothermus hydrogenoformans Z-2901]